MTTTDAGPPITQLTPDIVPERVTPPDGGLQALVTNNTKSTATKWVMRRFLCLMIGKCSSEAPNEQLGEKTATPALLAVSLLRSKPLGTLCWKRMRASSSRSGSRCLAEPPYCLVIVHVPRSAAPFQAEKVVL